MNPNRRTVFSNEPQSRHPQNPNAMSIEPPTHPSRPLKFSAPQTQKKPHTTEWAPSEDQIERDGRSVCVRNLDKRADEDVIRKLFRTAGNVMNITLNRDKLGQSKGYAYVEFGSVDSKVEAINKLNGIDMYGTGRPIIVEQKRVNQMGLSRKRKQNSKEAILVKALSQFVRMSSRGGRQRFNYNRGNRGGRGGMNGQNDGNFMNGGNMENHWNN